MANYRCERVFIMLDRPIPGLNHLKAVDPEALADVRTKAEADTEDIGRRLEDFYVAAFDGPEPYHGKRRWHPAAKGLKCVRDLIALYEKWAEEGGGAGKGTVESLRKGVATLRQLESVLDQADTRDINFYLAVKDL